MMSEPRPRYYSERELVETVAKVAQGVYVATLTQARQQTQAATVEALRAGVESTLAGMKQTGPDRVARATGTESDAELAAAVLSCVSAMHLAHGRHVRRVSVILSDTPAAEPAASRVEFVIE